MRVLIAIDDSTSSIRAARAAVRLFGDVETEFIAIHVTAPIPAAGFPLYPSGAVFPTLNVADDRDVRDLARDAGIPGTRVISASGSPVDRIVEAAADEDADVVVVGGHDKGLLERILDPSISQGVVRATHRPVLVVSGEREDDFIGPSN